MKESALSQAARNARNAYARKWREKNKDKVKAINQAYWEKKAKQASSEVQNAKETNNKDDTIRGVQTG